jgi:hypothetical protein
MCTIQGGLVFLRSTCQTTSKKGGRSKWIRMNAVPNSSKKVPSVCVLFLFTFCFLFLISYLDDESGNWRERRLLQTNCCCWSLPHLCHTIFILNYTGISFSSLPHLWTLGKKFSRRGGRIKNKEKWTHKVWHTHTNASCVDCASAKKSRRQMSLASRQLRPFSLPSHTHTPCEDNKSSTVVETSWSSRDLSWTHSLVF